MMVRIDVDVVLRERFNSSKIVKVPALASAEWGFGGNGRSTRTTRLAPNETNTLTTVPYRHTFLRVSTLLEGYERTNKPSRPIPANCE